jgi:glycopeptide antibiotics resistance protein|uniref:VanZ-like domain-containing protein n=1 Tax=Eubacterium plexicaudatum ASF492 TaxID=1235802 RepID=N1ZZL6_9FIRM
MKKSEKRSFLVPFLFVIYMALLVWIILFKLQFSISEIDKIRSINLIPFHYKNEIGMNYHLKEVLENVAIFIPLGIYLCMFRHEFTVKVKIFFVFMISLLFEIFQYILAVGRTDVTDLITNTCGGVVGIALYCLIIRVFHNRKQVNLIITILAAVVTLVVVFLLTVLLIFN